MNRDTPVNERIAQLLERTTNIKRGSDLHVTFDAKGEQHANRIAAADRAAGGVVAKRPEKAQGTSTH